MKTNTGYLANVFDDPVAWQKTVRYAAKRLRAWLKANPEERPALIFRGTSGAALGFPLATQLGLPMGFVRKRTDDANSHFSGKLDMPEFGDAMREATCYFIVDDMIASGGTVNAIIAAVDTMAAHNSLMGFDAPKGILLFAVSNDRLHDDHQCWGLVPPLYGEKRVIKW